MTGLAHWDHDTAIEGWNHFEIVGTESVSVHLGVMTPMMMSLLLEEAVVDY